MAPYEDHRHSSVDDIMDDMPEKPPRPLYERNQNFWHYFFLAAHMIFLMTWVTIALVVFRGRSDELGLTYSPAQHALHLQKEVFEWKGRPDSPYSGEPNELQEAAWAQLLRHTNMRFAEEEIDAIDPERKDQAISLPDGGYFGTLQVFHDLHCIKHLHRFLYSSHYFPDLTPAQMDDRRLHMEHCLDMLRTGVMCRGDITPITMRWGQKQAIPLANFSSPHACVNWDSLDEWAHGRDIKQLFEPGYLQHPVYGPVYGEDFDNKIGIVHDDS